MGGFLFPEIPGFKIHQERPIETADFYRTPAQSLYLRRRHCSRIFLDSKSFLVRTNIRTRVVVGTTHKTTLPSEVVVLLRCSSLVEIARRYECGLALHSVRSSRCYIVPLLRGGCPRKAFYSLCP